MNSFQPYFEQQSGLGRWGQAVLGATCSLLFYFTNPAKAAEVVLLQYADRQLTVSLTELTTFVETGEATPALAEFVQSIPPSGEFKRKIFSDPLPLRFEPSGDQELSRNAIFILYQINKLVGKPAGQENYQDLRTALFNASQERLTLLRLIAAYPDQTVRVELRNLEQVFSDVNLFLERIQPLIQSRRLIEDWLCECSTPPSDETIETALLQGPQGATGLPEVATVPTRCEPSDGWSHRTTAVTAALGKIHPPIPGTPFPGNAQFDHLQSLGLPLELPNSDLSTLASVLVTLNWLSQPLASGAATETRVGRIAVEPDGASARELPRQAPQNQLAQNQLAQSQLAQSQSPQRQSVSRPNRRLVVTFGVLGRSIAIDELSHFAATGEASRSLRSYLSLSNFPAGDLQAVLNRSVKADPRLVDRLLSNLLGEYVLFRASEIVHTRSRQADILALRSALILSLQDDQQISLIEFLERYPTQEIYIDGLALLKAAQLVQKTQQDVGEVTEDVGDWLVNVQTAIASEICDCGAEPPNAQSGAE